MGVHRRGSILTWWNLVSKGLWETFVQDLCLDKITHSIFYWFLCLRVIENTFLQTIFFLGTICMLFRIHVDFPQASYFKAWKLSSTNYPRWINKICQIKKLICEKIYVLFISEYLEMNIFLVIWVFKSKIIF